MTLVYPENFESKIGFDKIRELLKGRCLSSLGKELVDDIRFRNNYNQLNEELSLVSEFVTIIQEMENFTTSYYFDLRDALNKIRIEGCFLETEELFDLKRSLETISGIVRFLKQTKEDQLPHLKRLLSGVQVYPYVIRADRFDTEQIPERLKTMHRRNWPGYAKNCSASNRVFPNGYRPS